MARLSGFFNHVTGIYRSRRPSLDFPLDTHLSLTSHLFRRASAFRESAAVIDAETDESVTFEQLEHRVSTFARVLIRVFRISKRDVVLIISPNSVHFPVCFLSIAAIGAVASTCNPSYTSGEISRQISDCKPRLVITVPELYEKVRMFDLPVICFGNSTHGRSGNPRVWNYFELIKTEQHETCFPIPVIAQDDVAALLYSSGTTGTSKGVILTHRNFIVASMMLTSDQDRYMDPKNVVLLVLPMFHIMGLSGVTYAQLARGNSVVMMKKFELDKALRCIEKYRVSHWSIAPSVMVALVKSGEIVRRYDLSSLKKIGCGAAPLSRDVMEECKKLVPNAFITQGYGMTETCGVATIEDPREETLLSGSTGTLFFGIEAKIIHPESMEALPPKLQGEIWLCGPNITHGRFDDRNITCCCYK